MKNKMRKGILALMLAVGMTAAPVQAAAADLALGEVQGATFKQKSKVTLENTEYKNAADVKAIKRILEKNCSGDIQWCTNLDNTDCYKWTANGRLSYLNFN